MAYREACQLEKIILLDHIAQVDPNTELHAPFRFEFDIVPFHGSLNLDRSLELLSSQLARVCGLAVIAH
jgi:hypothetical protein